MAMIVMVFNFARYFSLSGWFSWRLSRGLPASIANETKASALSFEESYAPWVCVLERRAFRHLSENSGLLCANQLRTFTHPHADLSLPNPLINAPTCSSLNSSGLFCANQLRTFTHPHADLSLPNPLINAPTCSSLSSSGLF